MYKFATNVSYLGTGKTYRKGQSVPANIPNRQALIDSKAVYKVSNEAIPQSDIEYHDLSYQELGELMEERGLDFERSTDDRIKALLESDK